MTHRILLSSIATLLLFSIPPSWCQNTNVYPPRNKSRKNPSKSRQQQSSYQQQRQKQEQYFHAHEQEQESRWEPPNEREQPPWNEFLQDEKTAKALQALFQRTKPRGVLHAAWKATKSTALGFLLGTTSVFTFPMTSLLLGNYHWKPMLVSTMFGGFIGLAAVTYGIWNGLCQCAWGVLQTPKSIESWWTDSVWDPNFGTWEIYNLPKHAKETSEELHYRADDSSSYYQLLEVPVTATKSQIKKAYFSQAKKWHPDKNPNTPAEKFLRLHTAYQTLSDDTQRAMYDEWGEDGYGNLFLDPHVFFAVLFESYSMESYTGELAISSWAAQLINLGIFASNNEGDPRRNVQKLIQLTGGSKPRAQKRQVDIAMHLRDTVAPFVSGDLTEDAFREWSRLEAIRIVENGTFDGAAKLLALLGKALMQTAGQYRGFHRLAPFGWPLGALVWSRKSFVGMSNKIQFYQGAFQLLKHITRKASKIKHEKDSDREEIIKQQVKDTLPSLMRLAWNYNQLDIVTTIDGACWKLFRDSSVLKPERFSRAKAVRILGEEFLKLASERTQTSSDDSEPMDPAIRVEVAFSTAQKN